MLVAILKHFKLDYHQVCDALHVALILGRDVAGPVDPTVVSRHFDVQALEVATDRLAKVLAEDADHGPDEEDDGASLVVELEYPVVDVGLVELQVLDDVA
jgi:hypothetical protein